MLYNIWISNIRSGSCQPVQCEAANESDARRKGNIYIHSWNLKNSHVEKVEKIGEEKE